MIKKISNWISNIRDRFDRFIGRSIICDMCGKVVYCWIEDKGKKRCMACTMPNEENRDLLSEVKMRGRERL